MKEYERCCLICWNKFITISKKQKYCSDMCRKKWKQLKTEQTLKDKYWVAKICDIPWIEEKKKKTNLEKYWTEWGIASDVVKSRIKETNIKKYGFASASKNLKVKEKAKVTCLAKYWWWWAMSSQEVREKSKQTLLKKYWVDNISKINDVVNKRIDTCNKRYWVDNPSQIGWVQEKKVFTTQSNYWVPYWYLTEQWKNNTKMISKANIWRKEYLKDLKPELEFHIWTNSFDLKVWNVLLEIDPWPYHNSSFNVRDKNWEAKDQYYQYNKTKIANDNWYHCIHVFDREDPEKIKMLFTNKMKIGARSCQIKELSYEVSSAFLNKYHLQNSTKKNINDIYLWLYYKWDLIEVMVLWTPRNYKAKKKYQWEILRLCTHKDYIVIWWANKLFNYFIKKWNPSAVISYCDFSKFTGNVYLQMWFRFLWLNKPSWHWRYIKNRKYTKLYHITWELLRAKWFDNLLWKFFWCYWKWTSNKELMEKHWYVLIYDCWQATYVREK